MTGSVWVKCENRPQYCYMVAWCEDCGMGTPLKSGPKKYPVAIVIDKRGGLAGWSDHMDRAANYISFAEFVKQNNPITVNRKG